MATLSIELQEKLDVYRRIVDIFRENLTVDKMIEIEHAIKRLESLEITIAVFGRTNSGKSSLLNSLLGYSNKDPKRPFRSDASPNKWDHYDEENNSIVWREISGLSIIVQDTPGIGGDYPEHREKAFRIAKAADVVIFVTAGDIVGDDKKALDELLLAKIPLIVAINHCDSLKKERLNAISVDISKKWPELTESIVLTAGDPMEDRQKTPVIDDLVSYISTIIQIRQENLIWQTVGKHFKEKESEVIDIILSQKGKDARTIIHIAAGSAAAVSAAIPTPFDAPGLTTIHVGLVYNLGKMFDQKYDRAAAVAAYGVFIGALVGVQIANFAMNFLPPGVSNATRAAFTFAYTESLGRYAYNSFKKDYKPLPSLPDQPA